MSSVDNSSKCYELFLLLFCCTFDGVGRLRMPLGGSSGGRRSAGESFNRTGMDAGSGTHTDIHTHNTVSVYVVLFAMTVHKKTDLSLCS